MFWNFFLWYSEEYIHTYLCKRWNWHCIKVDPLVCTILDLIQISSDSSIGIKLLFNFNFLLSKCAQKMTNHRLAKLKKYCNLWSWSYKIAPCFDRLISLKNWWTRETFHLVETIQVGKYNCWEYFYPENICFVSE